VAAKTQIAQQEALGVASGGYSEGEAAFQRMIVDQDVLRQKLVANKQAMAELRAAIAMPENAETLQAMGVNPGTIGKNEIKTLIDRYKDAPKEKAILENLDRLKDLEAETVQLGSDVAEANGNIAQKMRDVTKSVAEYYRGIERQATESVLSIREAEAELKSSNFKATLQGALKANQTTFIGEYVNSLIEMFDALMEPVKQAIEFNRKQKSVAEQLADTLKQGQELSNSLPGGAFGGLNVGGDRAGAGDPHHRLFRGLRQPN
jgi:dGTP triphosphohydrolase